MILGSKTCYEEERKGRRKEEVHLSPQAKTGQRLSKPLSVL